MKPQTRFASVCVNKLSRGLLGLFLRRNLPFGLQAKKTQATEQYLIGRTYFSFR